MILPFFQKLEFSRILQLLYVNSPLGTRASIDLICRDYELEISGILITVDLRVIDMSEFDVILVMDWLMTYRVAINCESMRVTTYTQDGTRVTFQGGKHDVLPQIVYDSRWHGQMVG